VKKILYLECKTGAAGDMLMGALYSLLTEEQKVLFLEKLNAISEEVCVIPQEICKQGIGGIHMKVEINGTEEGTEAHHHHEHNHHEEEHGHIHDHEHAHSHAHGHHSHTSVAAILEQISKLDMSDVVKRDAEGIYRNIAAAESKVHQTDMEQIHFHEVGSVDALIDVVGSCLALELLGVDEVQASPVCVGNGTVRCAHGILPVPAPATAEIIKGMPVYCSSFDGELLTPTGAAILKYFVETYTKEMHMEIEEIGYGFGTKDFAQLSCVRAFLGYQK
jgi:uncharacterized protein (TIGR00299 family) protein